MEQRYITEQLNPAFAAQILEDCGEYNDLKHLLDKIYHCDTYKDEHGWRVQGYVFAKDVVNMNTLMRIPPCVVSAWRGEFILFFTYRLEFKKSAQG